MNETNIMQNKYDVIRLSVAVEPVNNGFIVYNHFTDPVSIGFGVGSKEITVHTSLACALSRVVEIAEKLRHDTLVQGIKASTSGCQSDKKPETLPGGCCSESPCKTDTLGNGYGATD